MTPEQFIAKWQASTRNERAACQEHFIDLCYLLGEPTPNTDPTGATYAFEKGATKATGDDGWADVWRKERFAWEYKGKRKDLDAAYGQLLQYTGALGNPPLLVVSDISRIVVRTNWTNQVSERHDILLTDLADPAKRALLKSVFSDPERLKPGKTREALTAQAAGEFADLAERLRQRGHEPQAVAHFVIRLAFCLFASDVNLLPKGLFARMLEASRTNPSRFESYAQRLFRAMAERDGEVDFTPVQWFNGGLFDDDAALPLFAADIEALERAQALDWSEIDPSIMGTLFERGLDPTKRGQLGAHYTDRLKVMAIITPVVITPLTEEWEVVAGTITSKLAPARRAAEDVVGRAADYAELTEEVSQVRSRLGTRLQLDLFDGLTKQRRVRTLDAVRAELRAVAKRLTDAQQDAGALMRAFLDHIRCFRILDPACGSGNFLYLALIALKDFEHQVMIEGETMGLQREFPQIGPEAVLGIELNSYAAELARVSVWIGHIQWARRHGYSPPADPVLQPLQTIECRDAVLAPDGTPSSWPGASAIVGNPPFLGNKRMLAVLTENYTTRLRLAYAGRVQGNADLVCYWFEKAREAVAEGRSARVGLVATQSIRKGGNRGVLDRITDSMTIFNALSDEAWTVEGADVRVSIVCFAQEHNGPIWLDGSEVPRVFADLTAGAHDLTDVPRLRENINVAFQGCIPVGPFDVPGATARAWLSMPPNANGRTNADVVRPWANADAITGRWPDEWVVDFGTSTDEASAAYYAAPFAHITEKVKPKRIGKREAKANKIWWRFQRSRPAMRLALSGLSRYIATPRVATHRLFVWFHPRTLADTRVCVFARDDDTTLGVLHSRFHEIWALRQASRHGVGNDPTYNHPDCFETFAFPAGLTPNVPATAYATDPRAGRIAEATRALVNARDRWLNPPELMNYVPEVLSDFPDRWVPKDGNAERVLKSRTLTTLYNTRGRPVGAWLDDLHRELDNAVAAAYGWPADISSNDALERILALNAERVGQCS